MERETNEIIAPVSKKVLILKAFLTGLEKRQITNSSMPTQIDYSNEDGVRGINPVTIMNNGEDMALKTIIVSIDGSAEGDFAQIVLDMNSKDSDFILAEVKKIIDGLTPEKKTI